jgi:hypothetical protein
MIDLPIDKALIAKKSNGKCNECIGDILFDCRHVACGDNERKDGKNVTYRVIDLPEPVDITPLLDALKDCQSVFEDYALRHLSKYTAEGKRKGMINDNKAREIAAVLEKWEADHERN